MKRGGVCLLAVAVVVVVVVVVVVTSCAGSQAFQAEPAHFWLEPNAIVEQVIDGDTIEVRIGKRSERVRLLGVDTPETQHPSRPPECLGAEATAFTRSLLPTGTPVRLERDLIGRDHFGRVLAHVHRASDGLSVNHALVREGYAAVLIIPPNTVHADTLIDAAVAAHAEGRGVWAHCGAPLRATSRRAPARIPRTRNREPPHSSPASRRRAGTRSARPRRARPAGDALR
jgi:micrococcal nuclease